MVRIKRGIDVRYEGEPRQSIADGPAISTVAVLGSDYPGLRFDVLAEPGSSVMAGQPLLRDRKYRDRLVVAPLAGKVRAVTRGARRSIETVVVAAEGDGQADFAIPVTLDRSALVALLLSSGLWAAVRRRPFGRPADLAIVPEALFITAMDTRPHAPDAAIVLANHSTWFQRGAEALTMLTPGTTYLCHSTGRNLPAVDGVTKVAFSGPHPAGLPTTHIHHLNPVGHVSQVVWQVGYQDVIALGHLLETGSIWTHRIVSAGGPALSPPTLIRTSAGANLWDLTHGLRKTDAVHLYSGSLLDGRVQDYLARGHLQVSAVPHHVPSRTLHIVRNWMRAGVSPLIPNAAHERAAPIGVLPIPFLRAISVGDVETARRLGALELVEEDLALFTHVEGGRTDFGAMLRLVLDELEESA